MSYRQKVVTGKTQQVQRDSTHTQWSLSTQVIEAERQHPGAASKEFQRLQTGHTCRDRHHQYQQDNREIRLL